MACLCAQTTGAAIQSVFSMLVQRQISDHAGPTAHSHQDQCVKPTTRSGDWPEGPKYCQLVCVRVTRREALRGRWPKVALTMQLLAMNSTRCMKLISRTEARS